MNCSICSKDTCRRGGYYCLKEGTVICHQCAVDIVNCSQQLMTYRQVPPNVFFKMDKFQQERHRIASNAKSMLLQLVEKIKAKPTKL